VLREHEDAVINGYVLRCLAAYSVLFLAVLVVCAR
jgi:hypothetical protein